MIPYGRQDINEDDIAAVSAVLRSDFLTQGPAVPRFERLVADYCGVAEAVAVNSATSALHIACLALGLGPGDRLWTSPITFVASANCARYCGASVDFVDVDPDTHNMCPVRLEEKLARARRYGMLPKIVVPVHFAGQPCDMKAISALAAEYGFAVVEDASHAIGARSDKAPVGQCLHSSITVFSFHPVKIVTTAEGGLATTNDPDLAERMRLFRSHGITRDAAAMTHDPDGSWYYQQIELGYNYRMTDIQAALGASQMTRLDDYVARRHRIARRYDEMLVGLAVTRPVRSPASLSALHLYVVRVEAAIRRHVFDHLRSAGIGVNVHYIPVHLQPYYMNLGFRVGDFPVAEEYYREAVSLPIYPTLRADEQARVVDRLAEALRL